MPPADVHVHSLRPTCGPRFVTLPVAQKGLGHSDIAYENEMERVYREIGDGTVRVEDMEVVYRLVA